MPSHNPSLISRILKFRYLFLLNLVVVGLLFAGFGREYVRARSIQTDIAMMHARAEQLRAKNLELSDLATSLRTESNIEREARLKLGLKKPGESVVVVHDGTPGPDPNLMSALLPEKTSVANPSRWWYYFFDRNSFRTLTYEHVR